MDYHLTTASMIIGVTFGLVMPVLANYLPIKAAMGVNLRTSLDLSRRTDSEIGVKIKTLDSIGIDTNQLIVSFLLIIIGFSTYYLVILPESALFRFNSPFSLKNCGFSFDRNTELKFFMYLHCQFSLKINA